MTLEDVGSVEAFLGSRAGSRAESADHVALIMSQSVAVLVVLASKAFMVVSTRGDWALLWSLRLVGEHMRF